MIRINELSMTLTLVGLLWYECSQDLSIFCYRIGCKALAAAHRQALEFVPVTHSAGRNLVRNDIACSNPSFTSYVRFMTPRDSKN